MRNSFMRDGYRDNDDFWGNEYPLPYPFPPVFKSLMPPAKPEPPAKLKQNALTRAMNAQLTKLGKEKSAIEKRQDTDRKRRAELLKQLDALDKNLSTLVRERDGLSCRLNTLRDAMNSEVKALNTPTPSTK